MSSYIIPIITDCSDTYYKNLTEKAVTEFKLKLTKAHRIGQPRQTETPQKRLFRTGLQNLGNKWHLDYEWR